MTPLWVHSSVRAHPQSVRRRASLKDGAIDHIFHYQGVKQSQLWLEVHRRHAPGSTDSSFEDTFRRLFEETARNLEGKPLHVIALGPGGGEKEAWLLEQLSAANCSLRYTPIDAGLELALLSAEVATPIVGAEIHPIVGDLSLIKELPDWLNRFPSDETRVYTAFGLSPNFLPSWLFSSMAAALRDEDVLLLSANLAPTNNPDCEDSYLKGCETILSQYDNAETVRWLTQVLIDWGIRDLLSPPRFHIRTFENVLGFCLESEWLNSTEFDWENEPFFAQAGQKLRLFFSLRYTPAHLSIALSKDGLQLENGLVSPCGQEGVWRVASSALRRENGVHSHVTNHSDSTRS
jgi:L-histidine Nalpha-methyltransferase